MARPGGTSVGRLCSGCLGTFFASCGDSWQQLGCMVLGGGGGGEEGEGGGRGRAVFTPNPSPSPARETVETGGGGAVEGVMGCLFFFWEFQWLLRWWFWCLGLQFQHQAWPGTAAHSTGQAVLGVTLSLSLSGL